MGRHRSLGNALHGLRKRYNKTLRELAEPMKVTVSFLSDVENGNRFLSGRRILDAAYALDCLSSELTALQRAAALDLLRSNELPITLLKAASELGL